MSAARWPAPSAAASTTMRASRGGSGSLRSLRPSSVMRRSRVDGADLGQQRPRLGQRRPGRRIEERKLVRIGRAPLRQVEQHAGQIGGENFRPRIGLERRGLRLVPQPVADAGLGAAGAAAALVGGGARHPHGFEPRQADVRLVARHPRQPGIDHDADAVDGQRGFRDRCRQHHLAAALRRRRDGAVLGLRVERAVQRHDVDGGIGDDLLERRLGAADFRLARQERQDRAGIGAQRPRHRVGDLPLDHHVRIAAAVARLDGKRAALALDHRRVAQKLADPRAVERRRHHHQAEIVAQVLLHVARQRQAEIGVERALVEFVEQHRGDAVERRIVEDQPREDAFGHHLDPRLARHLRAEPNAQAHRLADALADRSLPSGRRRRGRRAAAAPAPGFSCRWPTARRRARAAPAWSCRRRAAPPARRCAPAAAPRSAAAAPRRSAVGCRSVPSELSPSAGADRCFHR